jgi:arginase family enzyme
MLAVQEFTASVLTKGAIPVALGGDRSITYPLVQAFSGFGRQRNSKVGLIQLSSQLATADAHLTLGEYWAGSALRHIMDGDHVNPSNIVVVGIHGLHDTIEWDRAIEAGITVLPLNKARQQGMATTAQQALTVAARGTESVYVSLDISVVDGGHAPGQGQIQLGGLTSGEFLDLARHLSNEKVGAVDSVGIAPTWDQGGRTQGLIAEALIEIIAPHVFH